MNLRKLRVVLASIFFVLLLLSMLDFTGVLHKYLSWMESIQFVPALLASNFVVLAILLLSTLIFGRVYCSIICPFGVLQDLVISTNKKSKKYSYHKPLTWLRVAMLVIMVVGLILSIPAIFTLLDPYASFTRIATNLVAPIYEGVNNLFALLCERIDSYLFYSTDLWIKVGVSFFVSVVTFVLIVVLSKKWGRIYCNSICPVGTILGFVSKFSIFKPMIDTEKCIDCGVCALKCRATCIDSKNHKIDYSRCVVCMDCLNNCSKGAIVYKRSCNKDMKNEKESATSRRAFFVMAGLAATQVVKAQTQNKVADSIKVDGGLAPLHSRVPATRGQHIVPPGAKSWKLFSDSCTACGLCVNVCPNGVLRPSDALGRFMQPEMSFERGYCRPECNECGQVCPTNAISLISKTQKSSTAIGHAVCRNEICQLSNGKTCSKCVKVCPSGALSMAQSPTGPIIVVDDERCIGCGACEYVCPIRPQSAIHIEGYQVHRII